jgi:hypothetical protein
MLSVALAMLLGYNFDEAEGYYSRSSCLVDRFLLITRAVK